MVFIRVPTFKTALHAPSAKHRFDQAGNFTPLQKMMLSRNRIWGNIVGGTHNSGFSTLKKPLKGKAMMTQYENAQLQKMYPFVFNWDKRNALKEKYQDRKLRIFMRGMKIGQQKGKGMSMDAMSVFSKGAAKDPEFGQKLGEASLSDDSLGISSDGQ